jgi:hypothetical protein
MVGALKCTTALVVVGGWWLVVLWWVVPWWVVGGGGCAVVGLYSHGVLFFVQVDRCPSGYPFLLDETGSDGFLNACAKGNLSVVEWWYNKFHHDSRFDIHRKNADDDSALLYAVESGNVALCDFLYDHGCTEVSQPVKHNCMTLLPIACKECHLDVMRWLGDKGAVIATPSFP